MYLLVTISLSSAFILAGIQVSSKTLARWASLNSAHLLSSYYHLWKEEPFSFLLFPVTVLGWSCVGRAGSGAHPESLHCSQGSYELSAEAAVLGPSQEPGVPPALLNHKGWEKGAGASSKENQGTFSRRKEKKTTGQAKPQTSATLYADAYSPEHFPLCRWKGAPWMAYVRQKHPVFIDI